MTFEIQINNKPVTVKRGETILEVLNRIGIKVPTLCSMKGFAPTGMCRMCVIEVEGKENLIPACSFKVEEWMKIQTHSPRVVHARKTIVELLLANHPDDCLFCERNGNCELQTLAEELHVRERTIKGEKRKFYIDQSALSIVYDTDKCILCGRCIRVCRETIGNHTFDFAYRGKRMSVLPALNKNLNHSNCLQCGQCIMVCPTAALSDKVNFSEFKVFFHDVNKKAVAVYSPAVATTLAETLGLKSKASLHGILSAVFRKLGFDYIIDSSIGADLMLQMQCEEFISRLKANDKFPMVTSCCPSWVKYFEQLSIDNLHLLSSQKSSGQMAGHIAKRYISKKDNIAVENIITVSIVPCTSRKYEAKRPEMVIDGITDTDAVITTRELLRMIKMNGIDINNIEPEPWSGFFATNSSAGKLVNIAGGTTEAFIINLHYELTGKILDGLKPLNTRNLKEYKEFSLNIGDHLINFVIVNGLSGINKVIDIIKEGKKDIHFIEVMVCQGGCIAGGGQPLPASEESLKLRLKNIYEAVDSAAIRTCYENASLAEMLREEIIDKNNLRALFLKKEVLL
ncbi:MAG TPA: [Fe-Fe] hydrogenase large subunit C-terminal domain-containing protein [Bacteroidales bacterium]|nr:[Fe-Fe] hydrogenase large subunit C-terminal domain-containing protein [Bacteroidales bacterium]